MSRKNLAPMFSLRYDEPVEHEGFEPSGTSLQSNTRNRSCPDKMRLRPTAANGRPDTSYQPATEAG